jgi:hypothetical protein
MLRYKNTGVRRNCNRATHLFVCPGISEITRESFHRKTRAHAHRVDNMEGFEDDQFQTFWRGRDFVDDDRDAGNCTGSGSRARLAGFLPEPGCRIPIKRDSECYGIGTWRLLCERASKAPVSEALRQRSQVTVGSTSPVGAALVRMVIAPAMRTSRRPVGSKGGPSGRLCYWALSFKCRIRPAQCSGPGKG